jgi:hypothetical protein
MRAEPSVIALRFEVAGAMRILRLRTARVLADIPRRVQREIFACVYGLLILALLTGSALGQNDSPVYMPVQGKNPKQRLDKRNLGVLGWGKEKSYYFAHKSD